MDFEQDLSQFAESYARQGYEVMLRPPTEALPPFAQGFHIEILAKRGNGGVLVAVKKDRDEMAADPNLPEYARLTAEQPGWRFDLVVAEQSRPSPREFNEAPDFSAEDIEHRVRRVSANDEPGIPAGRSSRHGRPSNRRCE